MNYLWKYQGFLGVGPGATTIDKWKSFLVKRNLRDGQDRKGIYRFSEVRSDCQSPYPLSSIFLRETSETPSPLRERGWGEGNSIVTYF